jgi:hypothetical protein
VTPVGCHDALVLSNCRADFDIHCTLFRVRQQMAQGCAHLYPARALQGLASTALPRVVVHSVSGPVISAVLNKGKDVFLVAGNAIDT